MPWVENDKYAGARSVGTIRTLNGAFTRGVPTAGCFPAMTFYYPRIVLTKRPISQSQLPSYLQKIRANSFTILTFVFISRFI